MKKLRKILATISTVTLMSCVWGVNTHAEVKRNDLGVPTHIEAKDIDEFLDDLEKVLEYISSQLEITRAHYKSFTENTTQEEIDRMAELGTYVAHIAISTAPRMTDTYNQAATQRYKFVCTDQMFTAQYATSYLYHLLQISKIASERLAGVWIMIVDYTLANGSKRQEDVVLRLPVTYPEYCICNLRWTQLSNPPAKVSPTTIPASLKTELGPNKPLKLCLGILNADANTTSIPELVPLTADDLSRLNDKTVTKLISISKVKNPDEGTRDRFLDSSNNCTDFNDYLCCESVAQRLTPKPLNE